MVGPIIPIIPIAPIAPIILIIILQKKECPERHSFINICSAKIWLAEEISRLAKCEKPQHT